MQPLRRTFIKTLAILVPLSADNLTSLLSPVLGQYGIVVSDFVTLLQGRTSFLDRELTVRVLIQLSSNTLYTFTVDSLSYNLLGKGLFQQDSKSVYTIYKIIHSYSFVTVKFNIYYWYRNYLNFKGYLKSYN